MGPLCLSGQPGRFGALHVRADAGAEHATSRDFEAHLERDGGGPTTWAGMGVHVDNLNTHQWRRCYCRWPEACGIKGRPGGEGKSDWLQFATEAGAKSGGPGHRSDRLHAAHSSWLNQIRDVVRPLSAKL